MKDGSVVEPFEIAEAIVDGRQSADDWRAKCRELGIADVAMASLVQPGQQGTAA
jgi:hypothetical protein